MTDLPAPPVNPYPMADGKPAQAALAQPLVHEPAIEVKKLWTVFKNGNKETVVHKDLDLSVERGEVLSLVGGSGTGKTVLLRQILGLEQPTKGSITVLGQPAAELGRAGAAARVGVLFQQGALFSAFTVLENIAFALSELRTLPAPLVREAAMVKLQLVGLNAATADKMPSDLSGGMIKRVALARALIMDPPLLLLDEPTAGLDPESADSFCALLGSLHADMALTVVMVTHDLDTLFDLSTRIAVLADQKVIINAPPKEVVAFKHPFIDTFFLGPRGQRASVMLKPAGAPATPAAPVTGAATPPSKPT